MRKEYDFREADVGKYARSGADGTRLVLVDPDVVRVFPDSKAVNAALRTMVEIIRRRETRRGARI